MFVHTRAVVDRCFLPSPDIHPEEGGSVFAALSNTMLTPGPRHSLTCHRAFKLPKIQTNGLGQKCGSSLAY